VTGSIFLSWLFQAVNGKDLHMQDIEIATVVPDEGKSSVFKIF
jgi:hypothetical protein